MKKNKSNLDEDLVLSTIQVLSAKTKADPNPEDLEALKKLIRKNVPSFERSSKRIPPTSAMVPSSRVAKLRRSAKMPSRAGLLETSLREPARSTSTSVR